MSVPRMPQAVWDQMKNAELILPQKRPEPRWGYWSDKRGVLVLYNLGSEWALVPLDKDPPPLLRGRMTQRDWALIQGGKLDPTLNVIEVGKTRWQLHHLRGGPGRAVPSVVQRQKSKPAKQPAPQTSKTNKAGSKRPGKK